MSTLILILLLAQARSPRPGSPPSQLQQQAELKPEDYARVEGVVTNAMTGEPIRRTDLQLTGVDRRSSDESAYYVESDAQGRFAFPRVAPGRFVLRPNRTGFVQKGTNSPLQLAKGQSLTNLTIAMLPQAVVTGRVLDEEGEPVARASVTAYRYRYPDGRKALLSTESVTSNDLGEYRLWGLPRGSYYIAAISHSSWTPGGRARARESETVAPTFHPASSSIDGATLVRLTPGAQQPNVDIRMTLTRTYKISGTVVDDLGQNVKQGSIQALSDELAAIGTGQNRGGIRDGQFNLAGLLPGSYRMIVEAYRERGVAPSFGTAHVDVGTGDITGYRITMKPPEPLQGHVEVTEGEFDPAVWKTASLMLEPLRMRTGEMNPGTTGSRIGEDGKFKILNIVASNYRVRTQNIPPGFYLKAIRLGSREVQEKGIDLTAGVTTADELGLIFGSGACSVEGTVRDTKDEPRARVIVVLVPKYPLAGVADSIRAVTSGADGTFQFPQLAPGEYDLYAFEDAETGSWFDPEFRAMYRDRAKTVRVEKSATAKVDPRAITVN